MFKPTLDPDDAPVGICDNCGEACTGILCDMGIGSYEFWGARGTHCDWQVVSPCCDAKIVEGGETIKSKNIHVARCDHADGKIKKGDRYTRCVYHRWRKNGPGWYAVEKIKLINS